MARQFITGDVELEKTLAKLADKGCRPGCTFGYRSRADSDEGCN
jgi:hypothetical protein